jgi:hypothetical protein
VTFVCSDPTSYQTQPKKRKKPTPHPVKHRSRCADGGAEHRTVLSIDIGSGHWGWWCGQIHGDLLANGVPRFVTKCCGVHDLTTHADFVAKPVTAKAPQKKKKQLPTRDVVRNLSAMIQSHFNQEWHAANQVDAVFVEAQMATNVRAQCIATATELAFSYTAPTTVRIAPVGARCKIEFMRRLFPHLLPTPEAEAAMKPPARKRMRKAASVKCAHELDPNLAKIAEWTPASSPAWQKSGRRKMDDIADCLVQALASAAKLKLAKK